MTRFLPHRVADSESVQWGSWYRATGEGSDLVEEQLPGWDYAQELRLEIRPQIGLRGLCDATGVQDVSCLEVVAAVDCPATGARFIRRVPITRAASTAVASASEEAMGGHRACTAGPGDAVTVTAQVTVPPGAVADYLELRGHLVLGEAVPRRVDGVAWQLGSRLAWSESKRLTLEGVGGRFPTEPAAFGDLGWKPAIWSVDTRFDSLDDSFMGAVRLFINTDHPVSKVLLDPKNLQFPLLRSFLKWDIVRQLLETVITEADCESASFEASDSDSLGAVLDGICSTWLRRDLAETVRLWQLDRQRCERLLQAAAFDSVGGDLL